MYQAEVYKKMKPDLSGSRSKNRFRLELLWGIDKILELMEAPDDFTVVFDYVCDIEVHKQDSFEFYQIKTHKESQPKYTVKNLVNIPKGKEGSVLGKLFALVEADDCVEVILVCNRPFSVITDEPGLISLNKLENDDKEIPSRPCGSAISPTTPTAVHPKARFPTAAMPLTVMWMTR